eukprot:TRINITY_DN90928_c0_g1_i1.p1 TRINITY_DN90928_c0_g1~~TRINITY_DN90928_c0_g1_i1.p1  ORF type:complete len:638 (-),score=84.00 TRINITY_DN90928_c0_g1_i1:214-2127(-)
MAEAQTLDYPLQLGLAYLLLVGYLMRTVFASLALPGAVGVIFSGFLFSHFMQSEIFAGRDDWQRMSFFLVLLTAGCEISIRDVRFYTIVMVLFPGTVELIGIAFYARFVFEFTWVEAAVTGTVCFALGDGLVIPKLGEFGKMFPRHKLPRLMFTCAPLEASWALTLFGVISGIAEHSKQPTVTPTSIVLANIIRLMATVGCGACLGVGTAWFVNQRSEIANKFGLSFTHTTVEAYLIVLAVALAAFGLGMNTSNGDPLVPLGFCPGSLFQPELIVIVMGSFFGLQAEPELLHCIESTMGGVWVFGQLVLFSMLGSKTDVAVLALLSRVLPMLVVGLFCRFLGVLLATYGTMNFRHSRSEQNRSIALAEAAFIFLSSLPRATIQGALGNIPATHHFFTFDPSRAHVAHFIASTAKLYIVCMSVLGCVLLHVLGPYMLEMSSLEGDRKCNGHALVNADTDAEVMNARSFWRATDRDLHAKQSAIIMESWDSFQLDSDTRDTDGGDVEEDLQPISTPEVSGQLITKRLSKCLSDISRQISAAALDVVAEELEFGIDKSAADISSFHRCEPSTDVSGLESNSSLFLRQPSDLQKECILTRARQSMNRATRPSLASLRRAITSLVPGLRQEDEAFTNRLQLL